MPHHRNIRTASSETRAEPVGPRLLRDHPYLARSPLSRYSAKREPLPRPHGNHLLLGMVAMSVTAISFGRMANVYPASGLFIPTSAAFQSTRRIHLGWAMFLEYLFQPIQNSLYAVLTIHRMVPRVPFALLAALTVGFITLMTVQGIKFTSIMNPSNSSFVRAVGLHPLNGHQGDESHRERPAGQMGREAPFGEWSARHKESSGWAGRGIPKTLPIPG